MNYIMFSVSYPNKPTNQVIQLSNDTPKICLNMIVKNESKVILRLLNSVLPLIDGYCICDTGSTDNTIQLIQDFMREKNIPGTIVEEPFQDFGYNRTFALKAAAKMKNMDYLLLMDADMILTGEALKPEYVYNFKKSLEKDCYHICQGSLVYYYKNVRIVKNYKDFSYWGVTHEYVKTPEGTEYVSLDNNVLFIEDIGDGGAKTDKFERDIKLLKKGLEENPDNDRYTFYLANSLRDAGRIQEAIDTFKKRIEIGGWIEEVWHSYYSIGNSYKTMGDMEKAIAAWVDAYNYHPKRVEALYEIISHYRNHGKNKAAYLYYLAADKSRKQWGASADYLFLQKDVYDYKLDYELSIFGYYIEDSNLNLVNTCMKVLAYEHLPDFTATNVLNNYKFYSRRLAQTVENKLTKQQQAILDQATDSLNITADGTFVKSTPSMVKRGNHLIVNVRYVNYRIDDNGNYVNQANIITRNAIAVLDISIPQWKIIQEFELKYDTSKDEYYVGLEDIRLFISNNKILYNANRGLPDGTMSVEHGEIALDSESTKNSCWPKVQGHHHSTEKNWVLFPSKKEDEDDADEFKMVYNWNPNIIVGDLISNQFVKSHESKVPYFFRHLRGSTNGVVIGNEIWFLCHVVSYEDRRYYYNIMVVLDKDTYQLKKYSPLFTFEGSHVEYTLGFVYLEKDDQLLLGYSLYDKCVKYMQFDMNELERDMINV